MRSHSNSGDLVETLKRSLKAQGWTARRIAGELGIGEATAKRWLAGKALTLDRLDRLAALCDLSLGELAREAERPDPALAHALTLAQERALSSDIILSFLFMTLLGGATPFELIEDFAIPEDEMDEALARLERLALIDRLPGGRVRARIDRSIVWRKAPMRALFEQHMKAQFMAMDFAADAAVYTSEIVKLSARGAATLAEMIEHYRRDVQAMAERDRTESTLPRRWYATLFAAREMDTSQLDQAPQILETKP